MQKVEDVIGPLEVGRTYLVPCLNSSKMGWVPVIPFIHQDPELGNPRHHVHYDYRFFDVRIRDDLMKVEGESVIPVLKTGSREDYTLKEMVCTYPDNRVDPCFLVRDGLLFVNGIDEACEGKTFRGRTCPHKGFSLEGIAPDGDGVVTCPLHGARWDKDGSYAGSAIIGETMLARYIEQVRLPRITAFVRVYTNDVNPSLAIRVKDLTEPTHYIPAVLEDVPVVMEPRPRILPDNMNVQLNFYSGSEIRGFFITANGYDKPLWMERFRESCMPRSFKYPPNGGELEIRLIGD